MKHPGKIFSGLGLAWLALGVGTDTLDSFERILCVLVLVCVAGIQFVEAFE